MAVWSMKIAYLFLLVVMGVGSWLAIGWITDWVLNGSFVSIDPLQANFYPKAWFVRSLTIASIQTRVNYDDGITEVTLTTNQSAPLQQLEFKFPLTEPSPNVLSL